MTYIQKLRAMDILISKVPSEADEETVRNSVKSFLQSNKSFFPSAADFHNCLSKLRLKLDQPRHHGKGLLFLPTYACGRVFLSLFASRNICVQVLGSEIFFSQKARRVQQPLVLQSSPNILLQKAHRQLDLRVIKVQFGALYHPQGFRSMQSSSRSFSIEWEEDFSADYSAWLEVGTECLRIKVGSPTTSLTKTTFIVNFTSIRKLAMGYEGNPYLCLDLDHPSIIEESDMYPASTGQRLRRRIGHTSEGIARVAQYAHHIRVVLHKDSKTDVIDGLAHQLKTTGLDEKKILRFKGYIAIDAHKGDLYADRHIHKLRRIYEELPWSIVFQVESLLKNGVLHTMELLHLMQDIQTRPQCIPETAVVVLRALYRAFHTGGLREPPTSYFQRLYTDFKQLDTTLSPNTFPCQYITFTPTRAFLRGPFPTRSNRVLRKYAAHEDRFIRVSFRDEDLLPYRESRDVDLWGLIEAKVGGILKNGFKVGNRHYQFLGYSISGLRNHSVWFMSPFIHPVLGLVTPDVVRSSLGDFTNVRQSPSMYGARLAQAFTSTVPTVLLGSTEWEVVDDLGSEPYQFTDGAGTMSESLGRQVWLMLLSKGLYDGIEPSAYQIRFKGFKGMLVVDAHFDETEGIRMRLRPSMRKFHTGDEPAELEIVEAFDRPHGSYLNRSLVLVLENLGVPTHAFISLQEQAAADVRDSDELSDSFHRLMEDRRLGHHFRLSSTIKQVVQLVRQSSPDLAEQFLRSPFLRHVAQVVKSAVLQDMKYGARVPIPKSYVLAGVPDEGPAYEMAGRSDVYSLQPGQVYACVHHPGDAEPTWLSGPCLISRSPIVHPGDVQKVHAIGKPSEGMFCAFAHLKNVVVLPSIGQRSLASCLGGGDVDGDTFSLIFHEPLFPPKFVDPGDYLDCKPHNIGRESTGEDVGDFVVKFITTDVLGQLSDRLQDVLDINVGPKNKTWTILAEMCAKAADYPKRGNPVVVDHEELARTVSLRKPDWRSTAREAGGPKAYYTSTSAVGHMFRSISTGEDSDTPDERPSVRRLDFSILPILGATVEQHPVPSSDSIAGLEALFSGYVNELHFIVTSHSLGGCLSEAEIVAGTILSRTWPKRWRERRVGQMNVHAGALVADVRRALGVPCDMGGAGREALVKGLVGGWQACGFAAAQDGAFGTESFGLIALGVVMDCWWYLNLCRSR